MSMLLKSFIFIQVLLMSGLAIAQVEQNIQTSVYEDSWPDNRFSLGGNGTVTDVVTNLMWKQCPEGASWRNNICEGDPIYVNWAEAHNFALTADYAGFTDWRVPNIKELASIAAYGRVSPAINLNAFPSTTTLDNRQITVNYVSSTRAKVWNNFRKEFIKKLYMLDTTQGSILSRDITSDPSDLKLGLLLVRQR